MKKTTLVVMIFLTSVGVLGCGSSSNGTPTPPTPVAPTISSVTDGAAATIETTTSTEIFPTVFTVTFDSAMDETTLVAENISLVCGELSPATMAFAVDSTKKILTLTPEEPVPYQKLECVLSFTADIKDSAGTSMAASTYTFTNACALDDNFSNSTATQACWGIPSDSDFQTWDQLLADTGIFEFGVGGLLFDDANMLTGFDHGAGILKSVTVSPDGFVIEIHISDITTTGDITNIAVGLAGADLLYGFYEGKPMIVVGLIAYGADARNCAAMYFDGTTPAIPDVAEIACPENEYYVRLTVSDSGATFAPEYSTDGVTYVAIPAVLNWPPAGGINLEDYHYLGVSVGNKDAGKATTATLKSVTSTGLSSTSMY